MPIPNAESRTPNAMSSPPTIFRAHRSSSDFEIGWSDGQTARIPFRTLRWHCPCAVCVDEMTGVRLLQWDRIPEDIAPVQLEPSGNYAVKIVWSDRHYTGIYTWDRLRQLAELPAS